MSRHRVGAVAVVLGAVSAGAFSAALINVPMAYATDPPDLPPSVDLSPPGLYELESNIHQSSIPLLYSFVQDNELYDLDDQAGTYDVTETSQVLGGFPIAFVHDSNVVIDSTGAAPAVGTSWDHTALAFLPFGPGVPAQGLFDNLYTSSPDGTTADLFEIFPTQGLFGNFFLTGPAGTLDEVEFFGQWLPIIDTPASTAISTGLDMDALGLADLGALGAEPLSLF